MQRIERTVAVAFGHPSMRIATLAWGGIFSLFVVMALLSDIRPIVDSFGGFFVLMLTLFACALLTLVLVGVSLWSHKKWASQEGQLETLHQTTIEQAAQISKMEADITSLQRGALPPDTHQRFEEIEKGEITLGWVEFYPTLTIERKSRDKVGPGPAILDAVFGGRTKYALKRSNWGNVLGNLVSGECDIVATPIYDIKERREQVEFTSPIFYADIGIFVAASNDRVFKALGDDEDLEFEDAIASLQKLERLHLCVHPGELQAKMATKYFAKNGVIESADIDEFSIESALQAMVDRHEKYASDLYFCERVLGESLSLYKTGKIKNVLSAGQLLFPVAFAVRKGDDTLRKYVNLRLMTIDGGSGSGIQQHLIDHIRPIIGDEMMGRSNEYFLRVRPYGGTRKKEPKPSKIVQFPRGSSSSD